MTEPLRDPKGYCATCGELEDHLEWCEEQREWQRRYDAEWEFGKTGKHPGPLHALVMERLRDVYGERSMSQVMQ